MPLTMDLQENLRPQSYRMPVPSQPDVIKHKEHLHRPHRLQLSERPIQYRLHAFLVATPQWVSAK